MKKMIYSKKMLILLLLLVGLSPNLKRGIITFGFSNYCYSQDVNLGEVEVCGYTEYKTKTVNCWTFTEVFVETVDCATNELISIEDYYTKDDHFEANCHSTDDTCTDTGTGGGGGGGGGGGSSKSVLQKNKWKQQAPHKCLTACEEYLSATGLKIVGNRLCVFRLTYQNNHGNGDFMSYGIPANSLKQVTSVIDRHLNEGRGITVGLDYRPNSSNEDGTDHFVVVTGKDYDSSRNQYYYTYMDPGRINADKGCNTTTNRLYIDQTSYHIHYDRPNDSQGREYNITHIRPNDGNCSGSTSY